MVLHLMNINAVKYKWSSGIVLMAGKLLHVALLFRKVNLYVSHHFFLLVTYSLPMKSQMCIHKFKIFPFWYYFVCSFKYPSPVVSSHRLTSQDVSLHLHASRSGEAVTPSHSLATGPDVSILSLYHVPIL